MRMVNPMRAPTIVANAMKRYAGKDPTAVSGYPNSGRRKIDAETARTPGMMMSPSPMNIASRSSPFAICSFRLFCSRYEYEAFFGTTRRIGSFWLVISSARVTMCFERYTAHASYTARPRSEEHTSELQSPYDLVCRLLLEKKKKI